MRFRARFLGKAVFVLAAVAFDWVSARLGVIKRHYRGIQIGAGVLNVPVEPFQKAFEGFAKSLNKKGKATR